MTEEDGSEGMNIDGFAIIFIVFIVLMAVAVVIAIIGPSSCADSCQRTGARFKSFSFGECLCDATIKIIPCGQEGSP